MKKEIGSTAGILALLAVIFHTQFPSGQERSGGQPKTAAQSQSREKETGTREEEPLEGPWLATRAFFNQTVPETGPCDPRGTDVSCLTSPNHTDLQRIRRSLVGSESNNVKMWSIVATVPNPLHTRLSLFLDRQIDAIVGSVQTAEWYLSTQWLPWMDRFDGSENEIDKRRHQRSLQREQELMPGVLVFRRFHENDDPPISALFVFLVPETPIGGIRAAPFYAAMQMAHAIAGPNKVGLLSPTFSGSFASLATLVSNWNCKNLKVITGKTFGIASSDSAARVFENVTKLDFRSGIAAIVDYDDAICEILHRYDINEDELEYLTESETVLGSTSETVLSQKTVLGQKDASSTFITFRVISRI
jgi:hypothetical protein